MRVVFDGARDSGGCGATGPTWARDLREVDERKVGKRQVEAATRYEALSLDCRAPTSRTGDAFGGRRYHEVAETLGAAGGVHGRWNLTTSESPNSDEVGRRSRMLLAAALSAPIEFSITSAVARVRASEREGLAGRNASAEFTSSASSLILR